MSLDSSADILTCKCKQLFTSNALMQHRKEKSSSSSRGRTSIRRWDALNIVMAADFDTAQHWSVSAPRCFRGQMWREETWAAAHRDVLESTPSEGHRIGMCISSIWWGVPDLPKLNRHPTEMRSKPLLLAFKLNIILLHASYIQVYSVKHASINITVSKL